MPRKAARDTKKLILQVALKQFSEKGFAGVGIRDIAKEVGIRESAIYRHYSGKQAIFDAIILDIEQRYQEETAEIDASKRLDGLLNAKDVREELIQMSFTMFQFYLETEYGSQLRRMLTIEQYRSSEISSFFRELVINNGLEYITQVFSQLIAEKVYLDADPEVMALQFYSPLYLLLTKYDNQPEKYEEALSFLEKHITQFNKIYLRSDQ
ncbi:TetR/AcrR family transcriptional regulator [Enterococcus raffinosus]|uniref:TetR/AcrR family transcriptional regulator n=1 Tax=Enterococcus raffinosus TaxID=71452 RepID=UPI001C0F6631|nr:TetR/AcrR family transcriptional regulator [Enterococcus raffinosus]MBU5362366.1 TetR/AcrR family transcriptional regulator [Enterococcus raffinosus]